jgi:hypothetical protein
MSSIQDDPCIVVDFRRNSIRIFKRILRELEYPKYVCLLVNPIERTVAVQVSDHLDSRTHRVPNSIIGSRQCYEIHSRSLLLMLLTCSGWDENSAYRMYATACLDRQFVVFKMDDSVRLADDPLTILRERSV